MFLRIHSKLLKLILLKNILIISQIFVKIKIFSIVPSLPFHGQKSGYGPAYTVYSTMWGERGEGDRGGDGNRELAAIVLYKVYSMHAILCYTIAQHMFSYAVYGHIIPILH